MTDTARVTSGKPLGARAWAAGCVVLIALQVTVSLIWTTPVGSPEALFWLVVVAASGCVLTSGYLLWRAHRDDAAELGMIGGFAYAVSILPLVHGLTVPGVLYGENNAVTSSVVVALPLAVAVALPMTSASLGRAVLRRWRAWVAVHAVGQTALAVALLVDPGLLPGARLGAFWPSVLAVAGLAGTLAIAWRHVRLYAISRRPAVLGVAWALVAVSAGNLVWLVGDPMSAGFWLAHGLDIGGVFGASVIAAVAWRRHPVEVDVFRPVTLRHPLDALEYGLDDVVREFVADLGRKDEITREHVKRTA